MNARDPKHGRFTAPDHPLTREQREHLQMLLLRRLPWRTWERGWQSALIADVKAAAGFPVTT